MTAYVHVWHGSLCVAVPVDAFWELHAEVYWVSSGLYRRCFVFAPLAGSAKGWFANRSRDAMDLLRLVPGAFVVSV